MGVVCDPAAGPLYEALLALQHRGQDAAGIVTADGDHLCLHKDNGMVTEVFSKAHLVCTGLRIPNRLTTLYMLLERVGTNLPS